MRIFISHASEDKDTVAAPLAHALRQQGYDVWYDDFSLKLGDSISQEIDRGLADCDYGVVILSESFFAKHWPRRELAGLVARESSFPPRQGIILPIWHELTADQVRTFSPTLADRKAVMTSEGIDAVVAEINLVTQFLAKERLSGELVREEQADARSILARIVPAGPRQPDGGLTPAGIGVVEELVESWNNRGGISLLATAKGITRERRRELFQDEGYVYIFPEHGMMQVWITVVDLSYETIGMVWTPPEMSDREYGMALEFFLREMNLLEEPMGMVRASVSPIINSPDSFWLHVPAGP